ncbi:YncE family protein [Thermocatellispora tengchongensis]|uniref:hypothetical protein n=1 Tax=Thermocatellispora tengchongensis TaxID=1073253 RepID=UPI003631F914
MPRPRGDRATALIATAVVGALVAVAAVFGVGISSANPALADVGAWLWSTGRGSVVHANGLSGEVDGRIDVRGKAGTSLKVVQDGATVLLVDERTGVVSRIEPSRLEVTQTRDFATAGLQFVVSGKVAYAVDPEGTVQRIDPATLNAIGTPLSLPRRSAPPASTAAAGCGCRSRPTAPSYGCATACRRRPCGSGRPATRWR